MAGLDIQDHAGRREIVERGARRDFRDQTDIRVFWERRVFPAVRVIEVKLVILAIRAASVSPAIVVLTVIWEEWVQLELPVNADLLELTVFLVLEVLRVVQGAFGTVLVLEVERANADLLARKVSLATEVAKVPQATRVPRVTQVPVVGPDLLVVCARRVRWDW